MRHVKAVVIAVAVALALGVSAASAPPLAGVLVPAKSLGGLTLGATQRQVQATWGPRHGVCRGCRDLTWYFNYARFEPQGTGATFRRGRAVALFTLWAPDRWRTSRGLRVGDEVSRASTLHRGLVRVNCGTYYALTLNGAQAVTSIYVHDEKIWGFGLSRPALPVCR